MKSLAYAVTISGLKYNIFLCLGLLASWFSIPWWGQAAHTKTISLSVSKSKIFPMVILPGFLLVHTFQVQILLNFTGVNNFLLSTPWPQLCMLVLGSCLTSLGLPLPLAKKPLTNWRKSNLHEIRVGYTRAGHLPQQILPVQSHHHLLQTSTNCTQPCTFMCHTRCPRYSGCPCAWHRAEDVYHVGWKYQIQKCSTYFEVHILIREHFLK